MPDRSKKPKLPRDPSQRAKAIVDLVTGEGEPEATTPEDAGKNPHAVALGRLGGQKGGRARAEKLTSERRAEIAKKAAAARWGRAEGDEK